jgi:hypothetical protein
MAEFCAGATLQSSRLGRSGQGLSISRTQPISRPVSAVVLACERHAISANRHGHDTALLVKLHTKALPSARQPRSERPKIYVQSSSHIAVVGRRRSEHYGLSHAFRHGLQFARDISDN